MEFVFLHTAEKDAPSLFQLIELSLRELFGAGVALLSLHLFRRKSDRIGVIHPLAYSTPDASLPLPRPDGSASWAQASLEIVPFILLSGALILTTYMPGSSGFFSSLRLDQGTGAAAIILLSAPFLLLGVRNRLPRWVYPLAGLLLGYSALAALRARFLSGWLILLLACLALAWLAARVHRFYLPLPVTLRRSGRSAWLDRTRVSFGA